MKQKVYRRGIIYYFKVWKTILKNSMKSHRTYKLDIAVRFIRTIFILAVQIFLLSLIFGDSEYLAGWSRSEAYLVAGSWNLFNYIGWALFGVNFGLLDQMILQGRFDYVILKPMSSSFYASFYDFFYNNFISALSGVILVGYYFVVEWQSLEILNIVYWVLAMLCGLFIWYGFYLVAASFSISNPKNGLLDFIKELLGLTKYPVDVFGESFKTVFYTALPIAFISTVPANILIGKYSGYWILGSLGVGVVLWLFGQFLWSLNLRKYISSGG